MKQIVQSLGSGETALVEAPAPSAGPGQVVIQTTVSLISAGTERMLVGFGKASMLSKARQQPDKVRQVLDKMRTDGVLTTLEAVRSKLGQPIPLGYCNVGKVVEIGAGVTDFAVGDRVVSNGPHADVVRVPRLLCARIPADVSDEQAVFTVVASIGLQGIRLAGPTLGESVVVTGAGLLGLLTIQLLLAAGCRVLAIDLDEGKLAIAQSLGAQCCNPAKGEDPVAAGLAFSNGAGVDAVIITASTESSDPVTQAAQMSRKRGRIVLVGVTGLSLSRADFYEKELSFQVSCSYGPGRYDSSYEEAGNDYPIGFVRWTEQRNFEAVLEMMKVGRIDTDALLTARYDFEDAVAAYQRLTDDKGILGLVLTYAAPPAERARTRIDFQVAPNLSTDALRTDFIGAGNYASRILIPAFKKAGAQLGTVVATGGLNAALQGERAGFAAASSQVGDILQDASSNIVAIASRHDSHAPLASSALLAGKHVFVEKPLALDDDGVDLVEQAYAAGGGAQLMVGFNRRFSPLVGRMAELLSGVREPKSFLAVMNAGAIPPGHWTQDSAIGGGRIIGEACHHIDLLRFLAGSPIVSIYARRIGDNPAMAVTEDKASITLGFADGSFGTILYLANGAASFPKERVEVFAAGRTLQLDNFRELRGYGWPGFKKVSLWRQDKGQTACVAAFLAGIRAGQPAIPTDQIFEVARATIEASRQLRAQ